MRRVCDIIPKPMAGISRPLFNLIFGTAADMVVVVSVREEILLEIVSTLCELGSLCTRANARNAPAAQEYKRKFCW